MGKAVIQEHTAMIKKLILEKREVRNMKNILREHPIMLIMSICKY